MNILFGEVTGKYLESVLNTGSKVLEHDGQYFDFGIEMTEETFKVYDTIGRAIPIGVEKFEEFYQAVKLARNYARALCKRAHIVDLVEDDEVLVCG